MMGGAGGGLGCRAAAEFKSTAYKQIVARDYKLLMSYDMRRIVQLKPPVLELGGGGTSAPRHRQASIAMLWVVESLEVEAAGKVKILSHNPGHDGAIVFLQDARLMMCIEAEKYANLRHSPS